MNNRIYFNSVASKWDEIRSGLFPDSIRETILEAAGNIAGKSAADIGAGTGFLTERLLKENANVIAIDHSEAMIRQLLRKFCCLPNLDIRFGDDSKIPIDTNSMDFVFANMFLHHVEDPQSTIKEMTRVLKPGGKLISSDLDEHNFHFLVEEQYDRWMGFNRENIINWFKEAGLSNISVNCANADCCSTSVKDNKKAEISIFISIGTK